MTDFSQVLSEDLSGVVALLGPGGYFCEWNLLRSSPTPAATVRTVTHCELVMLTHHDMDCVLQLFPAQAR